MAQSENSRKLERRARSYMVTKDIPQPKMDVVRDLMNNSGIDSDEKYKAIIELLQGCPDRTPRHTVEPAARKSAVRRRVPPSVMEVPGGVSSPTETSFYIDDLRLKYRSSKLFRKRHLARRNNRLGLGFRKRLIPSRRMMSLLDEIYGMQEKILARLSVILTDILNDESVEDPTCFNCLRTIRSWLLEKPLSARDYDSVKWMERADFERIFRRYLTECFAHRRMGVELKERVILEVENRLRMQPDLRKEENPAGDADPLRRGMDKRNLEREKEIFDYMLLFRSFLCDDGDEGNVLSSILKDKYGMNGLGHVLMALAENLIYQRPCEREDVDVYFRIEAPLIETRQWNYSMDYLKKIGKDPEALRGKELERLRERLAVYETVFRMLKVEDGGMNILSRAVELQWGQVDRRKNDPSAALENNFILYLDAVVRFFSNTFLPLINGSSITFRDSARDEFSSPVFRQEVFMNETRTLERLIGEINTFRSANPTLNLSYNEAVKIMKGRITTMNNVRELLLSAGDFFYELASRILLYYEEHRKWIFNGSPWKEKALVRRPVGPDFLEESSGGGGKGSPMPFYDCIIIGFERPMPLSERLLGKKVLGNTSGEGLLGYMTAYAFQAAGLCSNPRIASDMERRNSLRAREKELRG
jgi:hypothetical protein